MWAEFKTQTSFPDFTAAKGSKICKYYGLGEANTNPTFTKLPRTRRICMFSKRCISHHHHTKQDSFNLKWQWPCHCFFPWTSLLLFYPVFLNVSGDFNYSPPLLGSHQFKSSPRALGKSELSPAQIAAVHFPIKGMLLQNDVWLSVDHLKLSLLWSKTRIGGCPITCTGRKMHLWVTTVEAGWEGLSVFG